MMRRLAALFLVLGSAATATAASTGPRTTLVSLGLGGRPANDVFGPAGVSGDGRFVAFSSSATNLTRARKTGVFVRDRRLRRTDRVPRAAGGRGVEISANGRFVLF